MDCILLHHSATADFNKPEIELKVVLKKAQTKNHFSKACLVIKPKLYYDHIS